MKNENTVFTEMEVLSYTILLVDDSPVNLGVVVDSLERHGFDVVVAEDGEEAMQRVEVASPDLILLDVMMPGMDGFEVCRRLKADDRTRDIPVIFMTSLSGAADKVAGFGAGAVDYVTKPLQVEDVLARVRTHLALHDLKRRLAEKIAVQADHLDRLHEEHAIAAGYMNKLIALDKLKDPAVKFHLKPTEHFSGDLIAAARHPDGRLHLMLADSTGHGLSAALAAMPVIQPFYSMTGKGFGISTIAREINRKVKEVLPVSHFVAAILVSIDADGQMVEVWSGGCPPPLMLDGAGRVAHRFKARHLAMGILPPEQFDSSLEYFSYDDDAHSLLMFSDGVLEQENASGEAFGLARLLSAAESADRDARWQAMIGAIERHCGAGTFSHDDITLMMAHCELHGRFTGECVTRPHGLLASGGGTIGWQFALTLEMAQLRHLDVVPLLLGILQQIETDKKRSGEIFLILSEMFNNALDHGVLKLDSALKHHEDGMEKYFDERSARLASTEVGQIHLHLKKILGADGSAFLRIRMKDSGEGFDHQQQMVQLADCTLRHGRGISLLYKVCRSVQYLGNGSEVVVEFDLASGNR
ncbi:MAG TPA: SpoIIE family protein phosphatase [Gallionella sp.]|nr:SpoIIE family protein phosphatase [Gallionella sp.]